MRGSRQSAVRLQPTETQDKVRTLNRHRRMKVARAAHTTLVKVDQWGRGEALPTDLAGAIERAASAGAEKKKKA